VSELAGVYFCSLTDDVKVKAAVFHPQTNLNKFGNVQSIALFFGGVVYAFEGIGMVRLDLSIFWMCFSAVFRFVAVFGVM